MRIRPEPPDFCRGQGVPAERPSSFDWALAAAGHREAARGIYRLLDRVSPVSADPDPDLAQAAGLYVQAALAAGGRFPALTQWARYGYEIGRRLHGLDHEPTLQIGLAYAGLLADRGLPADAARVAAQVSNGYTRARGLGAAPTTAAQELLAVSLHRTGRCPQARMVISATWRAWVTGRTHHDERSMSLLASAGTIAALCGPYPAADDWVHQLLAACPPPAAGDPASLSGNVGVLYNVYPRRHHRVCAYLRTPGTARGARARSTSARAVGWHR